MKFSIVIPSFNDVRVIRTIKSILWLNYPRELIELIVVDGGSNSKEMVKEFPLVQSMVDIFVSEKDKGIFDGLNKGVDLSTGDVIFMIGSDDFFIDKDALSSVANIFSKKTADIVSCEMFYIRDNLSIQRHWMLPAKQTKYSKIIQLPHFSTFFLKSAVTNIVFNIENRISADAEYFIDIFNKKNIRIEFINKPMICMTLGGQSSKNNLNIIKGNWQLLRNIKLPYIGVFAYLIIKIFNKINHTLAPVLYKNKYFEISNDIKNKVEKF
jgi:glycosyltransferase involved in cell wall biosynthesis